MSPVVRPITLLAGLVPTPNELGAGSVMTAGRRDVRRDHEAGEEVAHLGVPPITAATTAMPRPVAGGEVVAATHGWPGG